MKKTFTFLIMISGLVSALTAQTALDPNQFVNPQITGPGVYTVEAGQAYAFDGEVQLDFEIEIIGPDVTWIRDQQNPPILVNTPSNDGGARGFFEIVEGGGLTVKNVMWTGANSNGEIVGTFAQNTSGNKIIIDNCVLTDWQSFTFRNRTTSADSLAITNCVFINGVRTRFSQWGGFPVRLDVAPQNVIFENNTTVNSGRLLCNSGPFHNANIHQIHNTYVNQVVAGEEQRANEFITANNIFYNYHFIGYTNEGHSMGIEDEYRQFWTTWNYFADSKLKLDSISLYLGQNLFYRPQEILDFFEATKDSLSPSKLWERPDVDSFIIADNNYRIGANYAQIEPEFTVPPGNTAKTVEYNLAHYTDPTGAWPDWRIPSPVTFDANGLPLLTNWPAAFDLTYSNEYLKTAGTDGLPLGDLNWYPEKKEDYLANRDEFIAALRDSMVNAKVFYDPVTMDETPLITEATTSSFEHVVPGQLYLSNYPNPFHQVTTIEFGLEQPSKVTLSVYNILGEQIYRLTENNLPSGPHAYNFNASDISSGIYLIKINAVGRDGINYVDSKKMILSR
jgi:hypothetical protein